MKRIVNIQVEIDSEEYGVSQEDSAEAALGVAAAILMDAADWPPQIAKLTCEGFEHHVEVGNL